MKVLVSCYSRKYEFLRLVGISLLTVDLVGHQSIDVDLLIDMGMGCEIGCREDELPTRWLFYLVEFYS